MANVTGPKDEWIDLGELLGIKCKPLIGEEVCKAQFKSGTFVITKDELKKMCEEAFK